LAFYIAIIYIIFTKEYNFEFQKIFIAGSLISLIGFFDDRFDVKPLIKLLLISIPCCYIILNGYKLSNIGTYEILGTLNLGKLSLLFTLIASLLFINAINYIDGIDGLLLSISIIIIFYFSFFIEEKDFKIFLNIIILFLIVNLIFNLLPTNNVFKSFSGNCGSYFIGFVIAFLMIHLHLKKLIHPSLIIWVVWYPVYDFLSVSIQRLLKNKKIYNPDRAHLHHYALSYFKNSHFKTTIAINLLNLVVISIGTIIFYQLGELPSLLMFIILFIFFLAFKLKNNRYQ